MYGRHSVLRSILRYNTNILANRSCRWLSHNVETSSANPSDTAGPGPSDSDGKQESIEDVTEPLKKQLAEIEDKYKRSLAETENVRQRMLKQTQEAKVFGIQGFCKDLLEVADVLSKATESVPVDLLSGSGNDGASDALRRLHEGLQLTETQLLAVFARHGLVKIDPSLGEKFDPNYHEALFQQPAAEGSSAGTVAVVSKVGYKLHERTLRPALVGVFGN